MSRHDLDDMLVGAVAGLVATFAMTWAMSAMKHRLPRPERYPLPPREIVHASVGGGADLALASHFAYGAATGALYGAVTEKPRAGSAIPWGLAVWIASYLGWLPALGILKPATRHPARRNALMLAAHVVWGATLGWAARRLHDSAGVFEDRR